ncbi:sodium-dependent dicarboxylate transporter 2/3/5 [Dysgonomonadaceae bacterium PH5-43]|nr:sodium-dependent dicarboxylate transporter 2/3/5 [Dysgonomonadaceae bacterium PH5-43]
MFKAFKGFHLLEDLQTTKLVKKLSKGHRLKTIITLSIACIAFFAVWFAPQQSLGLGDISIIEQRVAAIFVFAVLMWIMEVIPAWCTSVLVITLLLLSASDNSLWFLAENDSVREMGKLISYKTLLATFADPIIMLFLGGFILAIAATKVGLDVLLAKVMLKPFGTKSENVLLGFLLVTGLFSMFISNTATAAMMLAFLAPVLKALPSDGKGRIALALAIPLAANIGGIGTPIGTPPNAIALKYLNDPAGLDLNIGFGQWMSYMFPLAILLLLISWVVLRILFPFKQKTIHLEIEGEVEKGPRAWVVYITFAVTILMWIFDKMTGVNANVVAMIPIAVFCVAGIIKRRDLEEINWSVLWMVAGGFALGVALNETGLATRLVQSIPFNTWSPIFVIIGSGLLCWTLSNFISNTATASLLVPILAVVGVSMQVQLEPYGGVQTLLVGIALCASFAMLLPISTPPNALAHATGLVEQKDMVKIGLIVGLIAILLGYMTLIFLGSNGLL